MKPQSFLSHVKEQKELPKFCEIRTESQSLAAPQHKLVWEGAVGEACGDN